MLFDDILNDYLFVHFLSLGPRELVKGSTYLEETEDFRDMIPFIMVVLILLGYDERESHVDSLDSDPKVKERHVEVVKFLNSLVHPIVQIEWMDKRQNLDRPLLPLKCILLACRLLLVDHLRLVVLLGREHAILPHLY